VLTYPAPVVYGRRQEVKDSCAAETRHLPWFVLLQSKGGLGCLQSLCWHNAETGSDGARRDAAPFADADSAKGTLGPRTFAGRGGQAALYPSLRMQSRQFTGGDSCSGRHCHTWRSSDGSVGCNKSISQPGPPA
jgi:hypothetical protein